MRVIYLLLSFMLCFYPVTQAQKHDESIYDTGTKQPGKKDYT